MDNCLSCYCCGAGFDFDFWGNFKLNFESEWDSHTVERCFIRLAGAGPEKEPTPPMELYANDWTVKLGLGASQKLLAPLGF